MVNHPNRTKGRSPGTAAMQSIRAMRGRTEPAKLFLVCSHDGTDSYDLFVRADSATECVLPWRRYFGHTGGFPDRIVAVPPAAGARGAVRWTDLAAIARREQRHTGLCRDCGHHGSDCRCHLKTGGWIAYAPGE